MKEDKDKKVTPTINKIQNIFLSFLENEIASKKEENSLIDNISTNEKKKSNKDDLK